MQTITLPRPGGGTEAYRLGEPRAFPDRPARPLNRIAFAAAHVVADPLADVSPTLDIAVDWDRTIAYREHLWDLGLAVAEAMDTAHRGMGVRFADRAGLLRDPALAAARASALFTTRGIA